MSDLGLTIRTCDNAEWLVCRYEDTDQPMGIDLLLAGPDSDEYRKTVRNITNKRLDRLQRNKKEQAEHMENRAVALLAGCTLDWRIYFPAIPEGAKPPKFSKESAEQLYRNYSEIREQADRFIDDRRNFRHGPEGSTE